jgi:hypothetical protein
MGSSAAAEQYRRLTLLIKLLQEASTSLEVISDFLRARGAHHSIQNWETLLDKRILPALQDGKITEQQLISLLAEAEEHGRQHVFLFRCTRDAAAQQADTKAVARWAQNRGLEVGATQLHDLPTEAKVFSVRSEGEGRAAALTITTVELRENREYLGEKLEGSRLVREWNISTKRAVNVACLHGDGLLELRIRSRDHTTRYQQDVAKFWHLLRGLLTANFFKPVALTRAKGKLFENKQKLKSEVRYSGSELRNENGTVLTAAAGEEQQNLFDDAAAQASVDSFISSDGAYCAESNVWWRKQPNGVPARDVHVLLAGDPNEFAITAACSKADHEYVLGRVLWHGR